jgi:hypothetical protein
MCPEGVRAINNGPTRPRGVYLEKCGAPSGCPASVGVCVLRADISASLAWITSLLIPRGTHRNHGDRHRLDVFL